MEKIIINKLKTGSVFKITLIGLTFGFVPIFILMGIMSLFDELGFARETTMSQ